MLVRASLALLWGCSAGFALGLGAQSPAGHSAKIGVDWNNVTRTSETAPTTQFLANALTLRSNPLNNKLLSDLRGLHTNDTRLQLWFSVPNQAVAELIEPTATETFWDFSYMDPVVIDFFANTSGDRHVNMGTIPRWMFNVAPLDIPGDPAATFYPYTDGTRGELLKDPTGKQFADFQVRLFEWYTKGGFTDEIGKFHKSDHHLKIAYWGILNEPTIENRISVEEYTKIYDAVATAIRKIDPEVQFFGPEVFGRPLLQWERYFLDRRNHAPDAPPVEWFSFHNFVGAGNNPQTWQGKFFDGPEGDMGAPVVSLARRIQEVTAIRDELSPSTKIAIDELGCFDFIKPSAASNPADTNEAYGAYDPLFWVASGANFAANFITAEDSGVQIVSMTQMVGAPTQCEECSMINWNSAEPNAHFRTLQLVNGNFGPGDKLVETKSSTSAVVAQAAITPRGRKLLLVNTSDRTISVDVGGAFPQASLSAEVVDEASGEHLPRKEQLPGAKLSLAPFAVAVLSESGKRTAVPVNAIQP